MTGLSDLPNPIEDPLERLIDEELSERLDANNETDTTTYYESRESMHFDESLIPSISPEVYSGYHHVTWYVSNAKQLAFYYIIAMGFHLYAYKGLETGSRNVCSFVVKNSNVIFEFCSPLRPSNTNVSFDKNGVGNSTEINDFLEKHGEGVKDVAFSVRSVQEVYDVAISNGAKSIQKPEYYRSIEDSDNLSYIAIAKVQIFGDTIHSLIEKNQSYSNFLPGYELIDSNSQHNFIKDSTILDNYPEINVLKIDHCVQNQGWNQMNQSCEKYAQIFGFHQFWSVDEKDVSTEFSALKSIVMASSDDVIKMPINEPAQGRCKSQIEEFLEFYDGPGIQHIAILTGNIIDAVSSMKERGVEFISVPETYYDDLEKRLKIAGFKIEENLNEIRRLGILVDFDENGYLLQLFTKPLVSRPTVFVEIIQRNNHNGFGAGNFKALFVALESLQKLRGNLKNSNVTIKRDETEIIGEKIHQGENSHSPTSIISNFEDKDLSSDDLHKSPNTFVKSQTDEIGDTPLSELENSSEDRILTRMDT